jgi:hypothetical protein
MASSPATRALTIGYRFLCLVMPRTEIGHSDEEWTRLFRDDSLQHFLATIRPKPRSHPRGKIESFVLFPAPSKIVRMLGANNRAK